MSITEKIAEFRDVDKRDEILDKAGLVLAYFYTDPAANKDPIEIVILKSALSEPRFSKKMPDQSNHYYFYPLDNFNKNESLAYWQQEPQTGEVIVSINKDTNLRNEIAMAYVIARVSFIPDLNLKVKTHSSK